MQKVPTEWPRPAPPPPVLSVKTINRQNYNILLSTNALNILAISSLICEKKKSDCKYEKEQVQTFYKLEQAQRVEQRN